MTEMDAGLKEVLEGELSHAGILVQNVCWASAPILGSQSDVLRRTGTRRPGNRRSSREIGSPLRGTVPDITGRVE